MDPAMDAVLERNAALAVRLRHTIEELHHIGSGHSSGSWARCPHHACRKAAELLADSQCRRCGRPFVRVRHSAGLYCLPCWEYGSPRQTLRLRRDD